MNDSQYKDMISMLIQATRSRNLTWDWEEKTSEYSCVLDGCSIHIISSVNFQMQSESITLSLFNKDSVPFDSIVGDSVFDTERYNQLNVLYQEIRNSFFKIKESEEIIMNKLRELTGEKNPLQPLSSDTDRTS